MLINVDSLSIVSEFPFTLDHACKKMASGPASRRLAGSPLLILEDVAGGKLLKNPGKMNLSMFVVFRFKRFAVGLPKTFPTKPVSRTHAEGVAKIWPRTYAMVTKSHPSTIPYDLPSNSGCSSRIAIPTRKAKPEDKYPKKSYVENGSFTLHLRLS
jgi:hypothetical protein